MRSSQFRSNGLTMDIHIWQNILNRLIDHNDQISLLRALQGTIQFQDIQYLLNTTVIRDDTYNFINTDVHLKRLYVLQEIFGFVLGSDLEDFNLAIDFSHLLDSRYNCASYNVHALKTAELQRNIDRCQRKIYEFQDFGCIILTLSSTRRYILKVNSVTRDVSFWFCINICEYGMRLPERTVVLRFCSTHNFKWHFHVNYCDRTYNTDSKIDKYYKVDAFRLELFVKQLNLNVVCEVHSTPQVLVRDLMREMQRIYCERLKVPANLLTKRLFDLNEL